MTRSRIPRIGTGEAARVAGDVFGVEGDVEELDSYLDRNFLIGRKWVLKVANADESEATLDFQNRAMQAVAAVDGSLAAQVAPSLAGRSIETLEIAGDRHCVRLLSYLPGQLLGHARHVDQGTWRHLGEQLARIDGALARVEHPKMDRELPWDLAQAEWTIRAPMPGLSPHRRRLLERAQLQFAADVVRRLARLPRSVIHNDANELNVLVDDRPEGARIVGFIDFGDAIRTARIFEVAIACAYAAMEQQDPLAVIGAIAAGYHQVSPLSDLALRSLFPAACMRLVVSLTAAAEAARLDPDNEYAFARTAQTWSTLERLLSIEPGTATAALFEACGLDRAPVSPAVDSESVRRLRERRVAPSLSLSYREPLEIVRGRGQYLFDRDGRAYLDGVNNVCHVGHCHPRVVEAAQRQIAELNTNTRYLHENIGRYAERLTALFPEHLEVCFFVNSGSEANELALRLARTATGRRDMLAIEHGYHGHTSALIDLSSYKHAGPGGAGAPEWVHVVPCPDPYRGRHRGEESGKPYADEVARAIATAHERGGEVAGFIAEPIVGCGGQVVPPPGYLREAFEHVRAAGGLCIADEVQVGFGRVGSHWWGFETHDAVPDIVTLGKPIGNGHPLAAVVTTREIAQAFDNGMEFFATFGGNPVSCAVGLAVLDVLEEEGLREKAREVGDFLLEELGGLGRVHPSIGDVRGLGFYLGVEIVSDRESKQPDAAKLTAMIEAMRASGVLMSTDGPDHNVLKFKPPMPFRRRDAELFLTAFDRALSEERQSL
jgi:4-aminobutyrate aminotransferase-like enzyme/Ser/Thr protein kinase RdoA (MazF antagonist)